MKRPLPPRLGVDIGRVIIDGSSHPDGGDTAFFQGSEEVMLATPEMPGALEALTRLTALFDGRVWLVSKCGARVEERSRRWLAAHDFHERTGIPASHLRFCRERRDKRIHCERLGLTHFVDDRPDVHAAIVDVVGHRYLFGPQRERVSVDAVRVADWVETELLIEESLPSSHRPAAGA
ncbi:hypothetical protein [Kineosporia succinea]|uniref:tRNA(Leu) C34 or U34 (Ribose-2'-O)-methylase TrmL n=1 Tax=Kineosporia succinea TaxID=84632 RepID=A0ABT9P8Z9_9ACTN|nr:hypothetical protein [Kineosporia succinea]MDP9829158.1 tRNA(Leu) C34 or U34 (ribose-2'-O)-methylase TrmL [Kineosporia succinea]